MNKFKNGRSQFLSDSRQIEILVNATAEHETRIARQDAMIERLDAIIERMIYRKGRGGNDAQPQQ